MKTKERGCNRFRAGGASLFLVCTIGALFLISGSASAAEPTLEITAGADPVESIPMQIGAISSTEYGDLSDVSWSVHPAGATGCGPTPHEDVGAIATIPSEDSERVSSSITEESWTTTRAATWTPKVAGSYVLCGWLGYSPVEARASLPFTVRLPRLFISLRVPSVVQAGRRFHITTTAQAEAPRKLYEYVLPKRSGVCPDTASTASSRAPVIDPNLGAGATGNIWSVNGGPYTKKISESLGRPGAWLICAYYQYGSMSSPPEASASAAFRVKRASHR